MTSTLTINGHSFSIGGLTAAEAADLAAGMERAVMEAADYLDEIAAGQAAAAAAQPGGGPDLPLHCARCHNTGALRDRHPGLPDCWSPCPDCDDERGALAASLATIAPAFRPMA